MSDQTKKNNPALSAYRKTDIMTANKETILLMMYAGALRFLKQGIEAAENNNIEEKARMVGKTQEIITELRSTLNFEAGGELANQLEALYIFIGQRLAHGLVEGKTEYLREALKLLNTLNDAWEQAAESLKKERKAGA